MSCKAPQPRLSLDLNEISAHDAKLSLFQIEGGICLYVPEQDPDSDAIFPVSEVANALNSLVSFPDAQRCFVSNFDFPKKAF